MNTGEGLMAAIVANPDDNDARLVYADFLDEQPAGVRKCPICAGNKLTTGTTTCTHCKGIPQPRGCPRCRATGSIIDTVKCPNCHATGKVRDDTSRLFAEFIRLGCELEKPSEPGAHTKRRRPCITGDRCDKCVADKTLHSRKSELIGLLPGDVFGAVPWDNSGRHDTFHPHTSHPLDFDWKIRRGFLEEITLPAGVFWGTYCEFCEGRGHFQTSGGYSECPRCLGPNGKGTGRAGGYAGELFRKFPIRRVSLSGMIPWKMAARDEWGWWEDTPSNVSNHSPRVWPSTVAPAVFNLMWTKGQRHEDAIGRWLIWDAKEEAQSAFDTALLEYGRKEAAG